MQAIKDLITSFMATHENTVPQAVWGVIIPTGGFALQHRLNKLLNFLEHDLANSRDMMRVLITGYGAERDNIEAGVRGILARANVSETGLDKRVMVAHCQTTPGNAIESRKLMLDQGWGEGVLSDKPWLMLALGRHQLPRRQMCFEALGFRNMDLVCFDNAPGNLGKVDEEAHKYVENLASLGGQSPGLK